MISSNLAFVLRTRAAMPLSTELFYQAYFFMSTQNLPFYDDSILESTEKDDQSELQNTD